MLLKPGGDHSLKSPKPRMVVQACWMVNRFEAIKLKYIGRDEASRGITLPNGGMP